MIRRKVFEYAIRVAPQDIDRLGHVNNVVFLRYAQDAAVAHWLAAAPPEYRETMVWVVRRHENGPEHVHVLEMVGYTNREPDSQRNPVTGIQAPAVGDFLGLVGTHGARGLLDHVLATADAHPVPVQGLYLPDVPLVMIEGISHHLLRSDHAPFWRAGLPALMWTDTAEFRNPHYHRATDTPETLDYDFLAGVTRLLVNVVLSGCERTGP